MKDTFKNTKVLYFGFNNMLKHKRGVENVIDFQAKASINSINYYIHWDDKTSVYRYKGFLCIGIKDDFLKFFVFNWFIMRIKKKEKSIFIHSHNTLMSIFGIFQTNLLTVHDALYYQNKVVGHKFKSVFYLLEKILYRRVYFVHFISEFTKKNSLQPNSGNFIIIPNTSHLESYSLESMSKNDDKLMIEFSAAKTKVFVVRSMEERSRIDLLIKVAEQLEESDFEILIAGKGPLYDFYIDQIESLNLKNIKLLGYGSDANLIAYYLTCDIVLMPAEYAEGFGLPIIEGYLFNKPVIASNRCAIPEVIISEGFLFDNTVESIIDKLEFAKQKPIVSYKEYYTTNFSNAHILSQFNDLYKSLM
jgi:glycosyltransferase involved in cell wall biosynthesis